MEEYENCECIGETAKAIKVVIPGSEKLSYWIPKSIVHDNSEVYKDGTEGTLIVAAWFAEKEIG
jgi:hypothetical protein